MYAAYHNHVSVANVLIEHNCNIDSTDYVIIINLFLLFRTKKQVVWNWTIVCLFPRVLVANLVNDLFVY